MLIPTLHWQKSFIPQLLHGAELFLRSSASQGTPSMLRKLQVHHHLHKSPLNKSTLALSCTRSVQSLYPQPTSRSILILSSHTCVSFILWILEIFQDSYLLYLHKRFQDLFLANIYILVNKVFTVWDDDILTWCNHTITDISPFPLARTWTKSCHIPTDGDSTEIGWAMWIITTHHQA